MSVLQAKLDNLLSANASPRWFLVQNEYGEGKSHFHSFAREHALLAGYAVASLDVNNNDGALHQPQRHLAVVLESLRSPLPQFRDLQGFADIFRHWLETADQSNSARILKRLWAVDPWVPAGRDPNNLWNWSWYSVNSELQNSEKHFYYPHLLRFFSAEDLTSKAAYARFAASFRLQIIQQWLVETGHKGLLLFIDEVDNVIRQIHGRAHAGCFRTLAWYCSCPAFPKIRVIFASTPEVIHMLDAWGRSDYLFALSSQWTVKKEEVKVYEQWNREADALSSEGWQACPRLTEVMRRSLFERIAWLHRAAWGWSWEDPDGAVDDLASRREYRTTRRWVRACVQLLDSFQQATEKSDAASTHISLSRFQESADTGVSNRSDPVQSANRVSPPVNLKNDSEFTMCPICKVQVKQSRLDKHLNKVHNKKTTNPTHLAKAPRTTVQSSFLAINAKPSAGTALRHSSSTKKNIGTTIIRRCKFCGAPAIIGSDTCYSCG
jgi:hypothetical protein